MTALNAALAYEALDHIEANPDAYDRLVFISRPGPGLLTASFDGRVCLLAGDKPVFRHGASATHVTDGNATIHHVLARAPQLLGLESGAGYPKLFEPLDLTDLREGVELTFGPRPEPGSPIGTNAGHGYAWERPDGTKTPCGGITVCPQCSADRDLVIASEAS